MDPEEPGNPYTHWAYFEDEVEARGCAAALPEYLVRLDPPGDGVDVWLLRACRNVPVDRLIERHREVERIVMAHGGDYDFGETTLLRGEVVVDPALQQESPPTSLLAGSGSRNERNGMAKKRRPGSDSALIYETILRGLQDGTYPPGSLMPYGIQFAAEHQVSPSTVKAVMRDLVDEGWLVPRGPGKEHRVHPSTPKADQGDPTT